MWRQDIEGIGTNAIDPGWFRIGFYKNDSHPLEAQAVDQTVFNLKQAAEKVPGATVSKAR
jgi:hypothetical protein